MTTHSRGSFKIPLVGTNARLPKAFLLSDSCYIGTPPLRPRDVRARDAPERSPPQAAAATIAAGLNLVRLETTKGPVRKPPNRSRITSGTKDTGGELPHLFTFSLICSDICPDCRSAVEAPGAS